MSVTSVQSFYQIPQELIDELDLYRMEVERFQQAEISEEAFKAFRVPRGIYEQRGGETYMMRVKAPAGGLTPDQMEAVADLSERYGDGTPHVTDRQDVQLHGIRIDDTPAVLEALAQVNLTTRGGGGNTIRNITACAEAGICPQEAFDVAPHAVALSERYMADPRSGVLPGIIGCVQAIEAIKLLLGIGDTLVGRLLIFDALAMGFQTVQLRRDPHCPMCGDHPQIRELIDYEAFCGADVTEG